MNNKNCLGRALKMIRKFHNLSLDEAEQKLGISKWAIEKIESGEREVDLPTAIVYSKTFNYSLDLLHFYRERETQQIDRIRLRIADITLKILEAIAGKQRTRG